MRPSWRGVSITTSWLPIPGISRNIGSPERVAGPSPESAAYMFGTTRTCQFGPGGFRRISGGVWSSLPGQKGQPGSRSGSWGRGITTGTCGRSSRRVARIAH